MKRIVSWSLSLVVALVMFIGAIPAFAAAGNYAPLPADPVNVTLLYPGPSSYFQATISGTAVPSINGVYQAWCIDLHNSHLANYDALALNSYGTIPADDAALIDVLGLPKVNWVLNQNFVGNPSPPGGSGIVTWPDVQAAIWILLSQAYAPGVEEYPSDAARRTAIVNAANTFGGSFDPVFGQVSAVILDPIPLNRQLVVITLPVPNSNGGQNNDPAAVGDFVWNDVNHNGIQDAVEAGVAGVTVNLFDNLNTLVATTTTDVNGKYGFSVTAGVYCVQFVLPAGYDFTLPNQGVNDAIDSDADSTGNTALITLAAGQIDVKWDAGLYVPRYTASARTIGYWKNHQTLLASLLTQGPISLGDTTVTTLSDGLAVFKNANAKDARVMLKAQLLGSILNIRNGANPLATGSDIRPVIAAAQTFLATHTIALTGSSVDRTEALRLKDLLDRYNNSGE